MIGLDEIPKNRIVTLYTEDTENNELQGYIVTYDDEELIFACVDRYGENDGFFVVKTDRIYRVDYDSFYERKLEALYRLKKQKHEMLPRFDACPSLRTALLVWAHQKRKIATFFFPEVEEVCGYIENTNEYKIKIVDPYACEPVQGYTCVDPETAVSIWIDGRTARDSEMIHNLRGKSNG